MGEVGVAKKHSAHVSLKFPHNDPPTCRVQSPQDHTHKNKQKQRNKQITEGRPSLHLVFWLSKFSSLSSSSLFFIFPFFHHHKSHLPLQLSLSHVPIHYSFWSLLGQKADSKQCQIQRKKNSLYMIAFTAIQSVNEFKESRPTRLTMCVSTFNGSQLIYIYTHKYR